MKLIIFILTALLINTDITGQYTTKRKNPFHEAYHDSLKKMDYPYIFPLMGKEAYKKGYDLPFAWGISPAFFAMRQEIAITKTAIGINDKEPVDLTDYIQYGKIITAGNVYTIRPDLWVLPFLNVYGIFGFGDGNTEVSLVDPVVFSTNQESDAKSLGMGFTLAGGINGILLIIDNNFNWATTEKLTEPVPAYNFDGRIGHNFVSERRADRSLTLWIGAFFQKIKADTKGNIAVKDIFPGLTPEQQSKIKTRLDEWLDDLPPAQAIVAKEIIQEIDQYFENHNTGDAVIKYELDKKIAGPWNMIFGAQYQHNKHWMLRTEVGTFGRRSQFLLTLNYRFQGVWKKR